MNPLCAVPSLAPSPAAPPVPTLACADDPVSPPRTGSLRDWPAAERPRERLRAAGPGALSDSELLAILIRTGTPGRSAVDLGRALIQRFGHAMLNASAEALADVNGLGPSKISQIKAIQEIVRRSLSHQMRHGPLMDHPCAAGDYLALMISSRPYEVFVAMYLDARLRLIRAEETSRGTLTQTAVYPREIVRQAMSLNAAALVVAHNHPSGDLTPSKADKLLTQRLQVALDYVDVRLIDHFIVSETGRLSFAEQGLL